MVAGSVGSKDPNSGLGIDIGAATVVEVESWSDTGSSLEAGFHHQKKGQGGGTSGEPIFPNDRRYAHIQHNDEPCETKIPREDPSDAQRGHRTSETGGDDDDATSGFCFVCSASFEGLTSLATGPLLSFPPSTSLLLELLALRRSCLNCLRRIHSSLSSLDIWPNEQLFKPLCATVFLTLFYFGVPARLEREAPLARPSPSRR